jgi:hypothetical protein
VLAFCHCDKNTCENQLEGGQIYFDSCVLEVAVQGCLVLSLWTSGVILKGLHGMKYTVEESCSPPGGQEANEERGGARFPTYPLGTPTNGLISLY